MGRELDENGMWVVIDEKVDETDVRCEHFHQKSLRYFAEGTRV
jgi:hypothetical protein